MPFCLHHHTYRQSSQERIPSPRRSTLSVRPPRRQPHRPSNQRIKQRHCPRYWQWQHLQNSKQRHQRLSLPRWWKMSQWTETFSRTVLRSRCRKGHHYRLYNLRKPSLHHQGHLVLLQLNLHKGQFENQSFWSDKYLLWGKLLNFQSKQEQAHPCQLFFRIVLGFFLVKRNQYIHTDADTLND